jgi:hypothetical protein
MTETPTTETPTPARFDGEPYGPGQEPNDVNVARELVDSFGFSRADADRYSAAFRGLAARGLRRGHTAYEVASQIDSTP